MMNHYSFNEWGRLVINNISYPSIGTGLYEQSRSLPLTRPIPPVKHNRSEGKTDVRLVGNAIWMVLMKTFHLNRQHIFLRKCRIDGSRSRREHVSNAYSKAAQREWRSCQCFSLPYTLPFVRVWQKLCSRRYYQFDD